MYLESVDYCHFEEHVLHGEEPNFAIGSRWEIGLRLDPVQVVSGWGGYHPFVPALENSHVHSKQHQIRRNHHLQFGNQCSTFNAQRSISIRIPDKLSRPHSSQSNIFLPSADLN